MLEEDLLYTLALQRARGIGDIHAKKLIHFFGTAKKALNESPENLLKIHGLGKQTVRHLRDPQNLQEAAREIRYLAENAIGVSFFQDKDYPRHLSHCADAPVLLFKKGAIDLGHSPVISVVGTRKMTHYGKSFCENLLADLRGFNPVIVSGFAYGVDICAHRAALDNGLQTVAVLAHGFEELYPKSHRKYQQDILSNGGFLTDFWHTDGLDRVHFLRRNRIIAGLSEATVIIESAEKGGALVTADIADSYHRDVFALPGRSNDPFSRGCNNLIKQHKAAMLTSATDLIELLGWDLRQTRKETVPKKPVAPLDKQEQPLYDFLRESGKESLDLIALRCNLSVHQTSALLFGLEMKGAVRTLPGKIYEVT